MAKKNILLIEDEPDILELLEYNLGREGYSISTSTTGEDGLKEAVRLRPDLVLLDLMLPGLDGIEVCKILKADSKTKHIPIIMLTAKTEEIDIVSGLEVGADDYITKPFSPKVVVARIRAMLRRDTVVDKKTSVISIHNLTIDPGRHEVLIDEKIIDMTYTEFSILQLLASRPGWVYSRYQIIDGIRGDNSIVTDRAVDVQIVGLRKKLGSSGKLIETVRGVGYKMKEMT